MVQLFPALPDVLPDVESHPNTREILVLYLDGYFDKDFTRVHIGLLCRARIGSPFIDLVGASAGDESDKRKSLEGVQDLVALPHPDGNFHPLATLHL